MKTIKHFAVKTLSLLMIVSMLFCFPTAAFAVEAEDFEEIFTEEEEEESDYEDAVDDTTEIPDYNVTLLGEKNGFKAISYALSNILESGLSVYSSSTTDTRVSKALLKHLELNADKYSGISVNTDDRGQRYMEISSSKYESAANNVFGRNLSASRCDGYKSGKIIVKADSANGRINVFATPLLVEYQGDSIYWCSFGVYVVNYGSISQKYGMKPVKLDSDSDIECIGHGTAIFKYLGDKEDTEIASKNIRITDYDSDIEWTKYSNSNTGYTPYYKPVPTTQEDETVKNTETTEAEEDITEEEDYDRDRFNDDEDEEEPDEEEHTTENHKKEEKNDDNNRRYIISLVICIALISILVVGGAVCLIIYLVRKKNN